MRLPMTIALLAALASVAAAPDGRGRRIVPAVSPAVISPPVAGPAVFAAPAFDPGRWELRPRGGGAPEQICVTTLDRLLRLRHEAIAGCDQFAIKAPPGQVTVQYTCRGRGSGRTHLRFETARLLQIDTQGVLDGLPFEMSAEARRVGDCTG